MFRLRLGLRIVRALGDGNLHLNVARPEGTTPLLSLVEPFVYEWTAAAKGSSLAEHGVGAMKRDQLSYSKPSEAIEIMRGVKGGGRGTRKGSSTRTRCSGEEDDAGPPTSAPVT